MTKTIHFLSILAIAVILIGSISIGTVAFADEHKKGETQYLINSNLWSISLA